MAGTKQDDVFAFEIMVGGEYRAFAFDMNLEKITGTEALIADQYAGDLRAWLDRILDKRPHGADFVLMAFLAARREQIAEHGIASLDWHEFAELVAPYTLRVPTEPVEPTPIAPAARRSRAGSGRPARKTTTPKAEPEPEATGTG